MISFKAYGQRGILMATKTSTFMEYLKIHLISLEQDLEEIDYVNSHHFYRVKEAEIANTKHILSVATDIMNSSNERYN
jgi:hypothetical protein